MTLAHPGQPLDLVDDPLPEPGQVIRMGRAAAHAVTARLVERGVAAPRLERRDGPTPEHLSICMLAPRVDVGGGARILFEHANRLAALGHEVLLLSHYPAPDWFRLNCRYRHVPAGHDLASALPPCDIVVCGYWDQVPSAAAAGVAPVVHFEQGDFHLFEDLDQAQEEMVSSALAAANATLAVSSGVGQILCSRYGVEDVGVVHNAVDPEVFHPSGADGSGTHAGGAPYLLCVGWDGNDFKGIAEVRQVWARLRSTRPELRLVWVTPKPPRDGDLGTVVVAPPQDRLAELFRGAAVYLCASRYESFPLPPLEAMASGTPVVTTANVGVLEYARDGENSLVVPVEDVTAMAAAVARVLDEPPLADRLRIGGLKTATAFSWQQVIAGLDARYRELGAIRVRAEPPGSARPWKRVLPAGSIPSGPWPDQAEERLTAAMETTAAAEILVPVARPLVDGIEVYRWEVAARRPGGRGSVRVPAPHRCGGSGRALPYQDGLDALTHGRSDVAVSRLVKAFQGASHPSRRGAVAKWLAIALARSGRVGDALDVVRQSLALFPDNPDHVALWGALSVCRGIPVDTEGVRVRVDLLGHGTRYDDWLADPMALLGAGFAPLLLGLGTK